MLFVVAVVVVVVCYRYSYILLFIDVGGVEGACTSSYVDFHWLTTRDIDDVGCGDASSFRCRRVCRLGQWSTVVLYTCVLISGLISVLLI
jgi:hypothetical protein